MKAEKALGAKIVGGTRDTPGYSSDKPTIEILEGRGLTIRKSMRVDKDGTSYHEGEIEVISSRLSALLGTGNVPSTAVVPAHEELRLSKGTRQAWVDGETLVEYSQDELNRMWLSPESGMQELYLFDIVINNMDRHCGNILRDEKGKLHAIDNGRGDWITFDSEGVRQGSFQEQGRPPEIDFVTLPPHLKERWSSISKADVDKTFKGLGNEHRMMPSDIYDRMQTIINNGGSP
jgi:hypothetical protein